MRKHKGLGLLKLLVAFFAGVVVALFFLVPGKHGPTLLVNGDQAGQIADLSRAGRQIERVSDWALAYAYKTKQFVHDNVRQSSP